MAKHPDNGPTEISDEMAEAISGGPSRRAELDHVGASGFMVEISGVNAGYSKGVDGLQTELEVAGRGLLDAKK